MKNLIELGLKHYRKLLLSGFIVMAFGFVLISVIKITFWGFLIFIIGGLTLISYALIGRKYENVVGRRPNPFTSGDDLVKKYLEMKNLK